MPAARHYTGFEPDSDATMPRARPRWFCWQRAVAAGSLALFVLMVLIGWIVHTIP